MEIISWSVGWFNYLFPIIFFGFLVYYLLVYRKKVMKRYNEIVDKNLAYGKETVELLREIRDLLKR